MGYGPGTLELVYDLGQAAASRDRPVCRPR